MKYSFILVLLSLVFMGNGCMSIFSGSKKGNPEAWRPSVPASVDGANLYAGGRRALRCDDAVEVVILTGTSQPMQVSDVVDAGGMITLPLVGEFLVGNMSTSEAEKAISDAYVQNGYYLKVDVTVVCKNMLQENVVYISGAVNRKGPFPFRDRMTLRQAIVAAGDRSPFASNKVKVTRNGHTTVYDLSSIQRGTVNDPILLPNDLIEVVERWL